jgi:hypothetical protein
MACGRASRPEAELRGSLALRDAGPPVPSRRRPPVRAALVMPTTSRAIGQIGLAAISSISSRWRRLARAAIVVTAVTVALLVAAITD